MKNLLNKLTFVLISILILTLASCQKEEVKQAVTLDEITNNQVKNDENEFDQVGKLHNEVLTFIYDQKENEYNSEKLGVDELVNIVMKYQEGKTEALQKEVIKRMASQIFDIANSGEPVTTNLFDICKIFPQLCNPGPPPYNPDLDLSTLFGNLFATEDMELNYKNALEQINEIKDYEVTILNNSSLDDTDKKIQLAYTSTYRNSTQFWYNKINHGDLQLDRAEGINRPCVACGVVAADAAGGAIGMIVSPFVAGIHGAMASMVYAQVVFGF